MTAGLPTARIFVVSIPDVYRLWQVVHNDPRAVLAWRLTGFCRSMLARPTSTPPANEARRQRVRERVVEDNAQLEQICAVYV